MSWRGIIDRYRELLPVSERTPVITLGEGNTPLLPVPRLAESLGLKAEIYVKCEGVNPTGSFKDRGMTLAVSKAVEEGARAVICASTGNTSASAAAYSARAGLECWVIIPSGAITLGKLAQALVHKARVLAVEGNFDRALALVRELVQKYPVTLVNSLNPYRIEGQKTAAFEICDALGASPTHLCIPVGNAGNITAYWRGFRQYREDGRVSTVPRMLGFQAAGAAPLVENRVIEDPQTVATAIRIGNPASWQGAIRARDESGGLIEAVTDGELSAAYRRLADTEGIFCEPASAASVAGLIKLAAQGYFGPGDRVVCVLTGHGLKDPDFAVKVSERPAAVPASLESVERLLNVGVRP